MRRHAAILLDSAERKKVHESIRRMYELCLCCIGGDNALEHDSKSVVGGMALSPLTASRCMLDYNRTAAFSRGLRDAIAEMRRRRSGKKVNVLYAGCGPLATLALPQTMHFSPNEVEFTLLDVHENALECCRILAEALGTEEYFSRCIEDDATRYVHEGPPPDVIVVEAMNKCLLREPQAAITANLASQLAPDGIFLPRRISVNAYLEDAAPKRTPLGSVVELTKEFAAHVREVGLDRALQVDEILALPHPLPCAEPNLVLGTSVEVFGPHALPEGSSIITMDRRHPDAIEEDTNLRIRFTLGDIFLRVLYTES